MAVMAAKPSDECGSTGRAAKATVPDEEELAEAA